MTLESRTVRGHYIIPDFLVAHLYGVQTKEVNQAVRNNPEKFPEGFILECSKEEKAELVKNFDQFNISVTRQRKSDNSDLILREKVEFAKRLLAKGFQETEVSELANIIETDIIKLKNLL